MISKLLQLIAYSTTRNSDNRKNRRLNQIVGNDMLPSGLAKNIAQIGITGEVWNSHKAQPSSQFVSLLISVHCNFLGGQVWNELTFRNYGCTSWDELTFRNFINFDQDIARVFTWLQICIVRYKFSLLDDSKMKW